MKAVVAACDTGPRAKRHIMSSELQWLLPRDLGHAYDPVGHVISPHVISPPMPQPVRSIQLSPPGAGTSQVAGVAAVARYHD